MQPSSFFAFEPRGRQRKGIQVEHKVLYLRPMTVEIDALGLLCPLPVLKLRKRLSALAPGDQIRLIADDPAAVVDVPHFCHESGHVLLESKDEAGRLIFVIRKKGGL